MEGEAVFTGMSAANQVTDLRGKSALITGGHRGIGYAISVCLAKNGADIIIIDRKGALDSDVASICSQLGRKYRAYQADLGNAEQVQRVGEEACREGVDIVVNNAGVAIHNALEDVSVEDWDRSMNVNVRAALLLSQIAVKGARGMMARREGAIVNVSSSSAHVILPDHAAYSCSKAAMEHLTKQMAFHWGRYNIRANAVAPTVVLTEMGARDWSGEKGDKMKSRIALGRFVTVEQVANTVLFLASAQSGMVSGETIRIDGGLV